jgi:voltage-gated potassium channel
LELPVALLALLIVPALLLEDRATSPELQQLAIGVNWFVWLAFCAEFLILFAAEPTWATVKRTWFDLLLIVVSPPFFVPNLLQATRSIRLIRILRLVRLVRVSLVAAVALRMSRRFFAHRQFHFVMLAAATVVFLGGLGIYLVEGSAGNPNVRSFGDAIWWSIVTATTVGYGDVSPQTTEGRVIAVVLMFTGIGVIGVFTATVASFFFHMDKESPTADVVVRLDQIERKLDLLISQNDRDR